MRKANEMNVVSGKNHGSKSLGRRSQTSFTVETLENRRLLSSNHFVSAVLGTDGVLNITGSTQRDGITVALNGAVPDELTVRVRRQAVQAFTASSVLSISINGGRGDDVVTVAAGVDIPTTILGGKGDDTLQGGAGADSVSGDSGNDRVAGGSGDDILIGGAGKDKLRGGAGDDNLDGGRGKDNLDGGGEDDFLSGGQDDDTVRGGSGDDDLDGGRGKDKVRGGDGDDRVRGGDDRDTVEGGSGDDDVFGGKGRDLVRGGDGNDRFEDASADKDRIDDRGSNESVVGDQQVAISEVPPAVVSSFNLAYPNATVREIERETEDDGLVYKIDFLDANGVRGRAAFTTDGTATDTQHHGGNDDNGQPVAPGDLPTAVQLAFNGRFAGSTIRQIESENEDEGLVYQIDFNDINSVRRRATFVSDGTFLESEFR